MYAKGLCMTLCSLSEYIVHFTGIKQEINTYVACLYYTNINGKVWITKIEY